MRLPAQTPPDHAPPQHHLPLPSPRQKQRQHVVATSQNMQQTLPQTLRQHMDQRQSTQPCRHRKPTRYRRPEIPYRRLGSRHHCRQRTEKRIIDLGRTRYPLHIICKLDSLKAEDTARAAVRTLKAHKDRVHTITMDNGKEFYQHTKITKALKAETYFCRPYHSWEKGLNENTNGLIRQYFPKQTDFRNISDREIRRVQDELNHRPRKTLGYETPSVLFLNLFQPLIH
ncbi:transposase for IS1655 [Neisseria meningitidis]|nr:transposase for IS1655 [Neisseria meningitidis]